MTDQASILRDLMEERPNVAETMSPIHDRTARTIAVTSGKGGVGKSVIALNLAIALAKLESSVCLLDANVGLGNIDLLCGLNGYWNLSHVVTGARTLKDVILQGPAGLSVIPGASGLTEIADCPEEAQHEILRQVEELERIHDFLIIDTGTGIHRTVRQFAHAADSVLIVTTPEPTSIADAYATVKALSSSNAPELEVIVNQADSPQQARTIVDRLQQTSRLFLHCEVHSAGSIPRDPQVVASVIHRKPFVIDAPHSPASRSIQQLAHRLKDLTNRHDTRGRFFSRLWNNIASKAA